MDSELTADFSRAELLLGPEVMDCLGRIHVLICGLGGVGSWAAESLVRTGVRHITLVDADFISPTNINRQLPATTSTIGLSKVEVMRQRLLDINPQAHIEALHEVYNAETAGRFDLDSYDYVIDAIDSLRDKALLINRATRAHTKLYSSMGAALKLDPTKIQVAWFWDVKGCPLAAALRRRFKQSGEMPRRKFKCVYSPELVANQRRADLEKVAEGLPQKAVTNGSLCHTTAIFGLTLAGLVIEDATKQKKSD